MTKMQFSAMALVALLASTMSASAPAGIVSTWSFEGLPIAVNNTPAATTGNGTASSIGMNLYPTPNIGVTSCDVLAGSSGDTGINGVSDLSQIWRVRAANGPNGAANGWSSQAAIGTQGAVFSASTAGFGSITVGFDWYTTNQGEANLQLQYTTDGTTWKNVAITLPNGLGDITALTNSTSANTVMGSYVHATGGQDWFTGLTATISDPNAVNDANFGIRMVNASTGADCVSASGTALNNTSGNWRFDNVSISGTPQSVPEPSSILLVSMAGGLVAACSAARRANARRS